MSRASPGRTLSPDTDQETSTASDIEEGRNIEMERIINDLSSHPEYVDIFTKTHDRLMKGDQGPLAIETRYIIAIMAAGRHHYCCMINSLKTEFLHFHGDVEWLNGFSSIPRKLKKIYTINKILAHRPWCLQPSHFTDLTTGEDSWSLSELVHAIIILVHFHALSSFAYASGLSKIIRDTFNHECETMLLDSASDKPAEQASNSEPIDILKSPAKQAMVPPPLSPCSPPSVVGTEMVKLETLVKRMKVINEKSLNVTQEELLKRFESVEKQTAELKVAPKRRRVPKTDIAVFIEDPEYIYEDFVKRADASRRGGTNRAPTLRIQECSWKDQGFSLVHDLYAEMSVLLDEKFRTAVQLTYNRMGRHCQIDTSRFRVAIWNYIQCLYGIRHDDYDYNEVNQLLEPSFKTFIKNAVCYPERVTFKDCERIMTEFDQSEKIHLNLLILEARMQGELLYALRNMARFRN